MTTDYTERWHVEVTYHNEQARLHYKWMAEHMWHVYWAEITHRNEQWFGHGTGPFLHQSEPYRQLEFDYE